MAGPTDDPGLHEGLVGVDPDILGGKFGSDFRSARDFAANHPVPSDGKVIEEVSLSGGGATDTIEHGLGREPVGVVVVRSDTEISIPAYVQGTALATPKPNNTHMGLTATTAATVNLLVF